MYAWTTVDSLYFGVVNLLCMHLHDCASPSDTLSPIKLSKSHIHCRKALVCKDLAMLYCTSPLVRRRAKVWYSRQLDLARRLRRRPGSPRMEVLEPRRPRPRRPRRRRATGPPHERRRAPDVQDDAAAEHAVQHPRYSRAYLGVSGVHGWPRGEGHVRVEKVEIFDLAGWMVSACVSLRWNRTYWGC